MEKLSNSVSFNGLALIFVLWISGMMALSQNAPLVIAFAAPQCGEAMLSHCTTTSYPQWNNFMNNQINTVSGVGVFVHWADIDNCSTTAPCYDWSSLDHTLLNYINFTNSASQQTFNGKKIVLIIYPVNDASPNNPQGGPTYTPTYVFTSQSWANTAGGCSGTNCPLQDVVVCGAWKGDVNNSLITPSCPVSGSFNGASDWAIWTSGNPSTSCLSNTTNLTCASACSGGVTDFTGIPVVYEKPFYKAYQLFLAALAQHYNPATGGNPALISSYLAYVRVGLTQGGENYPPCTSAGISLQTDLSAFPKQNIWSPTTFYPEGFIVNTAPTPGATGTEYVALGAGTSGSVQPLCAPAGCTTGPDGNGSTAISGWYNAGSWATSTTNTAIWPGPSGEFGPGASRNGYLDNGFISMWPSSLGTTGYVAMMTSFLKTLNASFPFDINSHNGDPLSTPTNGNVAYSDSEALLAASSGVGFGIESLSISDSQNYAMGNFPTSAADWAHNFSAFPAPVHHLQTFYPGDQNYQGIVNRAAGFPISSMSLNSTNGIVTVSCYSDCSSFSGNSLPSPIFISGNSNPAFNGTWVTCRNAVPATCASSMNTLEFKPDPLLPSGTPTGGTGGTVWAPDYWPIIMPFAVLHNATSIEVYECDLDYAVGAYTLAGVIGGTNFPTTNWVPANTLHDNGCVEPFSYPPVSPVSGLDTTYLNAVTNTQAGQPTATSVRTGSSVLVNGQQF
jgi:hypothetical protein